MSTLNQILTAMEKTMVLQVRSPLKRLVVGVFFGILITSWCNAQQLLDDFNRAAGNTIGNGWTETETVASGARINGAGQLELGSTTAGRDLISQDVSGYYNTTFDANTCLITWAFNFRQSRATPSGFNGSNYGAAFVLGATSANLIGAGVQGYAVVNGAGGIIRLVRFNNGLGTNTGLTDIIATGMVAQNSYWGVRVTFNPATNQWQMFTSTLAVGTFSTTNMLAGGALIGSAIDATYILTNLPFSGALWNHSTGGGESALFDNIYLPQLCIPTVTFNSASNLASEAVGTITVNMTIFPATATGGNIVVTVANGPLMIYTTDYTTTPAVVGTDITIPVAAGATSASFTINVVDDLLDEGNEGMTFTISATTGDLVLGIAVNYAQTIVDNDGLPSVNFTTLSITALESGGVQTFNLSISPAPVVAGNVTITVANGPGIVCGVGQDYVVTGFGCVATFNIPFIIGQTSIFFQATLYDDIAIIEVTEQVTFTVTTVPAGMSIGTANSGALNIADNDSPATVLTSGDLVIVGINANNAGCPGGSSGEDFISFFCFKTIQFGTTIILSDNGWERCVANRWGNTEGTVVMTRTGPAIPAGQVITFRVANSSGAGNVIGRAPDVGWTCNSLNGPTTFNMNSGGDQVFFMQGGIWTTNTVGGHDSQYTGSVVYGFSTNPTTPWTAFCASPTGNQRSNLPPGLNCFSMAPTSATDFSKYIGPLTIATQRDWIIRVDNVANWATYASCGAYNAAAPNWLLAPTLPITVGGFTPGLWRGAVASTDWFDCKNWDDAEVPLATTNVRIDETAFNNCVVGVTAGGTAVCASMVQTNSGTPINLTVTNTSSLAVGGPITVQRTAAGTSIALTVLGNSTLTATNFTVQGTAANEAVLRNEVPANNVSFSGNLNIGVGGLVDLQGAAVGGNIFIGGNYSNAGPTEANLDENLGSLTFNGAAGQSISTSGFQDVFFNCTISKPSGAVTLSNPLVVRNVLNLSTGRLNTSNPAGLLTLGAGSSWINASDLSFVNGPMEKIGLTNFTFPVGKVADLRPCGLSGYGGTTTPTDAFIAEYFPVNAYSVGIPMEPTIDHISQCEYWTIGRSAGTADATVQLTWEAPASCGVSLLADLIVARWDGAIWRNRGNGGAAGTFAAGTIPTAAIQTLFSPWTLASISSLNPLPITLVEFSARPEGSVVRLDWVTASEQNNAFFTVERSRDGIQFEHVLDVTGALNSSSTLNYTELDPTPYGGLSYYRLRQTDTDGTSTLSPVVPVLFGGQSERPLIVFGNGEMLTAMHGFPTGSRYTLMDMMGRIIAEGITTMDGRTELSGSSLARGAYLLRVQEGDRAESARFVY